MADATTTPAGPKPGHAIGSTTKGAAVGTGLAGAIATLVGYALVKTGFETDPETVVVLAGALVTLLTAAGALIGGKLSPSDQGDPVFAQAAISQIKAIAERLAFLQGSGPERFPDDEAPGKHEADPNTGLTVTGASQSGVWLSRDEAPATGSTAAPAAAEDDAQAIIDRREQG